MKPIPQSISVRFGYAVTFTRGVLVPSNATLAEALGPASQSEKLAFVVDSNVASHHRELPSAIETYSKAHRLPWSPDEPPVILPGGEICKNDPECLQTLYRIINERRLCRHSHLVAIGGGALLDVAGYAAATAHRGIRMIRVPTTVLAQNDSAVGVKTGINAFGKKNFIGAFAPPTAVINDADFLTTLDQRDWLAGIAEAIKVALIKDRAFFDWIERHAEALVSRDMSAMLQLIHRCAELHVQHIASSGDPFESGSVRPLDFGHWAAHKLEQMTNFELRHGEAVAIGIALDVLYSHLIGSISDVDAARVLHCIRSVHLPTCHSAMQDACALLRGLEEFREHLGGPLTITLLRAIGDGYEVHAIDESLMIQAVGRLLR